MFSQTFQVSSQPRTIARSRGATLRTTRATSSGTETARSLAATSKPSLSTPQMTLACSKEWGQNWNSLGFAVNGVGWWEQNLCMAECCEFQFSYRPNLWNSHLWVLSFSRLNDEIENCQSYDYPNFEFEETTVTKFGLVCDNTDFVQSVSAAKELKSLWQCPT